MQDDKIPQGYKDSPLGIIPDDWEVKRLREVFDTLKSFSFSRNQMTVEKQKLRYIHYGDIHLNAEKDSVDLRSESLPYVFDDLISSDKITDKSFPLLKNRDIILADASEDYNGIGKAWEILDTANNKIIAGLHTIVLRDRANHTSIGYGRYLFRNTQTSKSLKRIAQGTKVYSISYKHISKLHLLFPPLSEQERITEILTCWDKAIEKQSQLIDKLEIRKRGLMQQLLIGKKRTKGFANTKWKYQSLENFITPIIREVPKPDKSYMGIGIRSHGKGTFLKPDERPEKNNMDKFYVVRENDLIVNITFAWEAAISIVRAEDDGALASHRFPTYTFIENKGHPDFFKFYILLPRMRFMLGIISPGGAGRNRVMSKSDFLKLTFLLPDYQEQAAIANILSTADSEIQAEKEKLTALKSQKKGLMQQLLTGKKRVVNLIVI